MYDITQTLYTACSNVGDSLGLKPDRISAWYLWASGAMVLLIGNIDADTIRIIKRWYRYEMLRYLYITAQIIMQGHATTMVAAGYYTLIPASTLLL